MLMGIKTRFINALHKNSYLESNGIAQHLDEMGCVIEETVVYENVLDECVFGVATFKTTFHIVAYRRDEEGSLEVIYQDAGSYENGFERHFRAANDFFKENIKGGSEVELINSNSISKQLERIGDEFSGQIIITVKDGKGITITTKEEKTQRLDDSEELDVGKEEEDENPRNENNDTKKLLTIPQLAEEFQLKESWLYERSRFDSLPGQRRVGKYIRIDRDEFYHALKGGKI